MKLKFLPFFRLRWSWSVGGYAYKSVRSQEELLDLYDSVRWVSPDQILQLTWQSLHRVASLTCIWEFFYSVNFLAFYEFPCATSIASFNLCQFYPMKGSELFWSLYTLFTKSDFGPISRYFLCSCNVCYILKDTTPTLTWTSLRMPRFQPRFAQNVK